MKNDIAWEKEKDKALVFVLEDGTIQELPLYLEGALHPEKVVVVDMSLRWVELLTEAVTSEERARRCFTLGAVNIRELAGEQGVTRREALNIGIRYITDGVVSDEAAEEIGVALKVGMTVRLAYLWSEE